jgi:hypothetical protein
MTETEVSYPQDRWQAFENPGKPAGIPGILIQAGRAALPLVRCRA